MNLSRLMFKRNNHMKTPAKLTIEDINPRVVKTQYAVRGLIPTRAEQLREQLIHDPESLPFNKIISANIGNPQQLNQKPLTFYRSVLSILQNPNLLNYDLYPLDVVERAKILLKEIGSVGAYSQSLGVPYIRKQIAHFISERDGSTQPDPNHIYLTTGASDAVKNIFKVILSGSPKDGVLIPIPQYPLYTAELPLSDATTIPYYLNEEKNWSVDIDEIKSIIKNAHTYDIRPKILVVINPGNPTGSVLKPEEIESILTIAAEYGLVVIADEVYQENIFDGEFNSFKKILVELQKKSKFYDNVQLCSLHSTSKGVSGECGQRAGYMELFNFNQEIYDLFTKVASISLCPVITGQALIELMINPPKEGDASYELDQLERSKIHESYKLKAELLTKSFNELEFISCQNPQGSMYLFPKLELGENIIQVAEEKGLKPDEFYCLELLEQTGICVVPGSGFGQKEGTFHLRTTFLPEGEEWINQWADFHKQFFEKYS